MLAPIDGQLSTDLINLADLEITKSMLEHTVSETHVGLMLWLEGHFCKHDKQQ